jgi:deoxyxylulose-5-phosphate synthase
MELTDKKVKIIRLLKINPVDYSLVLDNCNNAKILVVEEGIKRGGVGEGLASAAGQRDYSNIVSIHALDSGFVPHGDLDSIMDLCGFTAKKIAEKINNL